MTRPARNNTAALDAFIARKAEIDTMLARLAAFSDEHFNAHPERSTGATSASSSTTPAC